ncbi:response regulator [Vibrio ostreicida]|uniref:Response regulator n=1 Tax=Vibrio ostreicida TaxID=526588 RepID=A0ABT8BWD8_9VIBR|nr:response regulator [Vibrio ostreicida]MDN3611326.1 response regulator [Vibrio ostreicida]NPD09266.1 response regulator [Vibrio ostreicida]
MNEVETLNKRATVVIIEDEAAIADNLVHVLEMDGYQPKWFSTAGEGLAFLQHNHAALLVLDVGLPDGNGFELCKTIREFSDLPIIFLTARNDEIDRVVGLEIGADDYVTKPFSPREMLARVKLRIKSRVAMDAQQPDGVEPLAASHPLGRDQAHQTPLGDELKPENYDYQVGAHKLGLTAVEYKILDKLIRSSPQVLSREQLMVVADMTPHASYERNIDSHIKAIRHKLKPLDMSERICTKRGFGYYYQLAR